MARKSKLDLVLAKEIVDRLKNGHSLVKELKRNQVGYATWKIFCKENQIHYEVSKGKSPEVYTMEKAREVKRRANQGEFVSKVCEELGMNYNNFCRFCRKNNFKILTQKALSENIKRRRYGQRKKSIEVSRNEVEGIIQKVVNGSSLKAELKKAGFSYSTWRDRCLEYNVNLKSFDKKRNFKFTASLIRQLKKRVKNGETIEKICDEMNLKTNELIKFCKLKKISHPDSWTQGNEDSKKVKKVKKLLNSNSTPAQISKKLSISSSYVYFIKRSLLNGAVS